MASTSSSRTSNSRKDGLFSIAKPLERDEFLRMYAESSFLARLFLAPLGLDSSTAAALGPQLPQALEDYNQVAQQLQDVVSKLYFSAQGCSDDQVVASMNIYLGKNQDEEVIREAEAAAAVVKNSVHTAQVVEFDFSAVETQIHCGAHRNHEASNAGHDAASRPIINVCTAAVAAKLLQSVSSIVGKAVTAPTGAARTAEDVLEDLDQDIYLAFGFEVPRRLYSPLRQFSPQIDTSGTSPEGNSLKHWIMELLNSLTITLGDLLDEDESARAELEVAMKLKSSYTDRDWLQIPIKFTIPQFVALLDAFGKTPEIQSVVKLHCINAFAPDMQVDLIDKPIPVDCLRNGYVQLKAPFSEGNYTLLMNDRVRQLVQPSLHPIVVFVSQSIEALRRVSELEVQKEDSTKQVSGRDLFIKQLEESLDVVFESLAVLEKAQEASSSGSVETALDLVTSTLKKILLFEEDAEEDSELAEEREFHTIIHWQPCSSLLETEIENKDVVSTSEKFILQLRSREVTIVPVFLQTKLMLSRALYNIDLGRYSAAFEDMTFLIEHLNCFSVEAFSLRAQLCTGLVQQLQESDEEQDASTESDSTEIIEEIVRLKDMSAKDALAAFVLGGSTDLQLAATAEDAMRESCRKQAKSYFSKRTKHNERFSDVTADPAENTVLISAKEDENFLWRGTVPKKWFASSYFSGYAHLLDAFRLSEWYCALDRSCIAYGNTESVADIDEVIPVDVLSPPVDLVEGEEKALDGQAVLLLMSTIEQIGQIVYNDTANSEASLAMDSESTSAKYTREDELVVRRESDLEDVIQRSNGASALLIDQCTVSNIANCGVSSLEAVAVEEIQSVTMSDVTALFLNPRAAEMTGIQMWPSGAVKSISKRIADLSNTSIETEADALSVRSAASDEMQVSPAILARLLNLCGSLAYLAGDSVNSQRCFKASIAIDGQVVDSLVKLATLLVEMDEHSEALSYLERAEKVVDEQKSNSVETTRNRRQCLEVDFIVVQLHFAELQIHQTNFASALQHLRASQRALNDLEEFMEGFSSTQKMRKREIYYRSRQSNLDNILGNILALEAVTMMRHMPHYPEMAVRSIEEALKRLPRCTILLLCAGEIYCQAAGDMVRALTYYEIASKIEANENPLPYLNAARTYQQLAQFDHAWIHFKQAAEKDPELAMIKIDMAQALMQQGSTSRFDVFTQVNPFAQSADISNGASKRMVEVTALLDDALRCARQVSEIRDVFTAKRIAEVQLELEQSGMYVPL